MSRHSRLDSEQILHRTTSPTLHVHMSVLSLANGGVDHPQGTLKDCCKKGFLVYEVIGFVFPLRNVDTSLALVLEFLSAVLDLCQGFQKARVNSFNQHVLHMFW